MTCKNNNSDLTYLVMGFLMGSMVAGVFIGMYIANTSQQQQPAPVSLKLSELERIERCLK